jgi:hypothetical protein
LPDGDRRAKAGDHFTCAGARRAPVWPSEKISGSGGGFR